jgi:hypothetical protein
MLVNMKAWCVVSVAIRVGQKFAVNYFYSDNTPESKNQSQRLESNGHLTQSRHFVLLHMQNRNIRHTVHQSSPVTSVLIKINLFNNRTPFFKCYSCCVHFSYGYLIIFYSFSFVLYTLPILFFLSCSP